jgi:hypothetical protein
MILAKSIRRDRGTSETAGRTAGGLLTDGRDFRQIS